MKRFLNTTLHNHQGFSLVEFIVIISIFAIMAGVALFNFGSFNSTVSLNNLAHDIALTIRQAQVYGISATEGGDVNTISQVRGVYFPYLASNFDNRFVIFLDTDPLTNTASVVTYDAGVDVDLDQVQITTQDFISDIAIGSDAQSASSCTSEVVIAFKRPDPQPLIFCGQTPGGFARITIQSPNNSNQKFVEVWPTGQIAVVAAPTSGGQ